MQRVLRESNLVCTDIVVMGIIVIGWVACRFVLLMRRAERKLVPWMARLAVCRCSAGGRHNQRL